MALISCPECGKQVSDRAAACPDCGCPISTAPVVPVAAPVESNVEKVAKLLELAQQAKNSFDNKNAKRLYEQLLLLDPGNWEAIFYSVYYEVWDGQIMNIAADASAFSGCINHTLYAISKIQDKSALSLALDEVVISSLRIILASFDASLQFYMNFPSGVGAADALINRIDAIESIYTELEFGLKNYFPDMKNRLARLQVSHLEYLDECTPWYFNRDECRKTYNRLYLEIDRSHPRYHSLKNSISACKKKISNLVLTRNPYLYPAGWLSILFSLVFICGPFYDSSYSAGFYIPMTLLFFIPGLLLLILPTSKKELSANQAKKAELEDEIKRLEKEIKDMF